MIEEKPDLSVHGLLADKSGFLVRAGRRAVLGRQVAFFPAFRFLRSKSGEADPEAPLHQ